MNDFTEAVERIVAGLEKKKRVLSPKEREVVAYHEMGHALVAMSLPSADPVHKISIIPRGVGALGYTIQRPTEDRYVITREELIDKMAVLLGGRAAEWVVFHQLSTGAADDLAKVTDIARDMVDALRHGRRRSGRSPTKARRSPFLTGPPALEDLHEKRYSDETARAIDEAVQEIVVAGLRPHGWDPQGARDHARARRQTSARTRDARRKRVEADSRGTSGAAPVPVTDSSQT